MLSIYCTFPPNVIHLFLPKSGVTKTHKDGRTTTLEQVYLRGSHIRLFQLPDLIRHARVLKSGKKRWGGVLFLEMFFGARESFWGWFVFSEFRIVSIRILNILPIQEIPPLPQVEGREKPWRKRLKTKKTKQEKWQRETGIIGVF